LLPRGRTVPEEKDIERIEQVLDKIGENELDIGVLGEEAYVPHEEPLRAAEGGDESGVFSDLDELLKDIEVGLTEQKELEQRRAGLPPEGEEPAGVSPDVVPTEAEMPEYEEPAGVSPEVVPTDVEETFAEEPSFFLPDEFELPEEAASAAAEADAEIEAEIETGGTVPEIQVPASGEAEEEALSLPDDFDLDDLTMEEGPSQALFEPQKETRGVPPSGEPEQETEGEREAAFTPAKGEPSVEELTGVFDEAAIETKPGQELRTEDMREAAVETGPGEGEEEAFSLPEDFDFGDLSLEEQPPADMAGMMEERVSEKELAAGKPPPPVEEPPQYEEEEAGEIELPDLGELDSLIEEQPLAPPGEEELPIQEEEPAEAEGPWEEAYAPEKGVPEEEKPFRIDVSDEDVVLIIAKLKQIDPTLATRLRDIIVDETLKPDSLAELIYFLKSDAPQNELLVWLEGATGERIVPGRRVPEYIAVPKKPTAVSRIAENLGPVVRVAGLFVVVLAVVTVLFMLFIYRPMRAGRYYQEAIELLRNERYEEAEISFSKAVKIYEKTSEYDRIGWEYMLSGNYNEAFRKLETGVLKDSGVRNIDIRLHLAQLYNILGDYGEADALYGVVVERKPRVYGYKMLKGENLIDWGLIDPERFDEAYNLFREEYVQNRKNSDTLFHMLDIHLKRQDHENIDYLYGLLSSTYPRDVDEEVYTDLAEYYLAKDNIDPVRAIIALVIGNYPEYPDAYYAFAKYYEAIKNKKMQEELLKKTIELENKRKLSYPWEKRNRTLLSYAYDDLGAIYAGLEIPGMTAESIRYFKKAIDENDQNVDAYFNLAQVYFYGEKNYELARVFYERARRMGLRNNDLEYNLGVLYYYQNRFRSALRQWFALSDAMPDNPNIGFAIGSALLHLGEYNGALGEFLILEERYDDLVESLGEIKTWRAYHKRIILDAAKVNNNLGVTYQKLYEQSNDAGYQKKGLVSLYKGGELADIIGMQRGEIQYNINYIVHPEVIRGDMAVNDDISHDYRFYTQ
jgi:pilus assembly protein FimV